MYSQPEHNQHGTSSFIIFASFSLAITTSVIRARRKVFGSFLEHKNPTKFQLRLTSLSRLQQSSAQSALLSCSTNQTQFIQQKKINEKKLLLLGATAVRNLLTLLLFFSCERLNLLPQYCRCRPEFTNLSVSHYTRYMDLDFKELDILKF